MVIQGFYGELLGAIKGDTRSLDYSSCVMYSLEPVANMEHPVTNTKGLVRKL